jgi:hypothetical protein
MSEKKTHWKEHTDRRYIASWEFEGGEQKEFEIVKVTKSEVTGTGGRNTMEMVMYMKDSKPMVLNATNATVIETIAGSPYVEDWVGLKVTVFVDPTIKFAGEVVGGLRIALKKPAPKKKAALVTLEVDSDNFKKVTAFISNPDNIEQEFEDLFKKLKSKYKISPAIKKQIKTIYDDAKGEE